MFSAIEFGDEKEPTYATILLIALLSTCYALALVIETSSSSTLDDSIHPTTQVVPKVAHLVPDRSPIEIESVVCAKSYLLGNDLI